MKLLKLFITFLAFVETTSQNIDSCDLPENITVSRMNRLHHPCENNKNPSFAIELHDNFYCIFYSAPELSWFAAVTNFEIKVQGKWEYEQSGAEEFNVVDNTIKFTANGDAVKVIIKKGKNPMPVISSVLIIDGMLPEGTEQQEYCECECGVQDESIPIVLGGDKAREGAWPWHAAIYYKPEVSNLRFRCGATIINRKTLITTATCLHTGLVKIPHENLVIAVKETSLYGTSSLKQRICEVKYHEKFRSEDNSEKSIKDDYNVALMITENEIRYSLHVHSICLPLSDKFNYKSKRGVVVGWGYNKDHQLSQNLQQLDVPTFPFLECFFKNRDFFSGHSSKRNFCAGFRKDKGICAGDSGGGFFIKIEGRFFLHGISSSSNCKCIHETQTCELFDEGIFINVPSYLQWIHNNMY